MHHEGTKGTKEVMNEVAGTPVKPSQVLEQHRAEIRQIVERHRASNARVFGSVLRREDNDQSDLDLLVEPDEHMTLFDLGAIRYELRELLGVQVDVLTPNALPDSFRAKVLGEAMPV
jgi:predicted nucleotidyltransferase